MNVNTAEEIIDNMYQKRMSQMEEKTNESLIIHLGTKVEFTKEEEASVIVLRELQILRKKLENSIPISVIQNILEQNKAKTDCRYCNNACDSYAVCTVLKEILEKGNK